VSIDRRLREGFDRSSSAIVPNDHAALEHVTRRARRRVMVIRATTTVMVAFVVAGVALGGPRALEALQDRGRVDPVQEPTPSEPVAGDATLTGTYSTTLEDESPVVRENRMNGEWTITFRADDVLEVSAPESFQESRSGYSFEVSGDQFRTDLFRTDMCNDMLPGRYRWQRSGDRLTFDVLDEPCPARAALFASAPYVAQGL
jgi:hypothetical protein